MSSVPSCRSEGGETGPVLWSSSTACPRHLILSLGELLEMLPSVRARATPVFSSEGDILGKAHHCDEELCIPAQGLLQSSSARACSSPALLGSSLQESCWVSAESQVSGRTTGKAIPGTEHHHPHSFSPPAPCSACSHAVK